MIRIDRIIFGIFWALMIWPESRDMLMERLFCNPSLQNEFSESLLFGLGFCRYAWLLFFIVLPALSIISYWPWIRKFIEWINDMRN